MPIGTDTAIQLRLRIADRPRRNVFTLYGDGLSSAFELGALPGGIVTGGGAAGQPSAFIAVGASPGTAYSATGATFTYAPGLVTFSGVPSAGTAIQTVFWHAVFSDAEIDYITGNYGDLNGMTLEVINALMMDATKRVAWAGGGVSYNESTVFKSLKDMRDTIYTAMTVETGPQGGFESWADSQMEYPGSTWPYSDGW